jgi:hypothetical protein
LQDLQQRNIWQNPKESINVDDVVMLTDENSCRTDWKIARVVETLPSEDGHVRKVKLMMATSALDEHGRPQSQKTYLERPVHKLVVLVRNEQTIAE